MDDSELLPPRIVCSALDIPVGTLGTWAKRGYLANFDAALTSKGKARLFSLSDALALALVKVVSKHGLLHIGELVWFLHDAADGWLKPGTIPIRELTILHYPDKTTLRFNDDAMKVPPEPGAELTVTLNLDLICGAAYEALKATSLSAGMTIATEVRMEELHPALGKISRVYQGPDKAE